MDEMRLAMGRDDDEYAWQTRGPIPPRIKKVGKKGVDCAICLESLDNISIGPKCAVCLENKYIYNGNEEYEPVNFNGDDDDCKKHVFHRKCVEEWIQTREECPICKNTEKNLTPITLDKLEELSKNGGGKRKTKRRKTKKRKTKKANKSSRNTRKSKRKHKK